ncbi:MAG TPA: hypothetical protein PKD16_14930 [Saprospiraceae bacterium]|nr:hypothetical protein [Saprospiraceae bacterium]HMT71459.1 hypothetical protein [Saprospiraceae bacterium]
MKNNLRWDSYVLFKGDENIQSFWCNHLSREDKKILYVLGKGFDVRMNHGIRHLVNCNTSSKIECVVIEFDEGSDSSSKNYKINVDKNFNELKTLNGITLKTKSIALWKGQGRNKRRIGDKEAADIFLSYDDIKEYSDIVLDISALPRGVYFSLIGKLLTLIDFNKIDNCEMHNLFVITTENAKIDQQTIDDDIDEELKFSFGFSGDLELTSDDPVIWFPILGENKYNQIIRAYNKINPREICPLLPFPSKDPRRSDNLIIEYHQLLFDELRIESQNLLYVPEQNPFEVYRNLSYAIINYNKTLSILNGCKAAISTFSSKLLSIGAIITAYEMNNRKTDKIGVGILNVDSKGYKIEDEQKILKIKIESELFLTWLTGDPYNIHSNDNKSK